MQTRVWIALLLCVALGGLGFAQQAVLRVTNASAPPGSAVKVYVKLDSSPRNVADIQGTLTYNTSVMEIVGGTVKGLNGYEVYHNINAATGRLTFAAFTLGDGIRTGDFLEFEARAVGAVGASTPLDLTLQVLRDKAGADIPANVLDGVFTVGVAVTVTVDFEWTPVAPLAGQPATFTPTVTITPEDPTLNVVCEWTFGDGTGVVIGQRAQAIAHTFVAAGGYQVTLTVKVQGVPFPRTKTVTVRGPQADFAWTPQSPTTQDTVQFTDRSSTTAGALKTWTWTMGDGKSYTVQNPTHKYAQRGTYTVTLTVTAEADGRTLTSTATKRIAVGNTPPTADFTFTPTNPKIGELVTFNAAISKDPDGTLVSFEWDFDGDGKTDATGSTTQRAFQTGGTRLVKLTVTDNDGAQASVTRPVTVQVTRPTAQFTFAPTAPKVGETVTFKAEGSSAPDGTIVLYAWDFTADGVVDATGLTVTYVFRTAGNRPVTLTITDSNGNIDAITKTVPVSATGVPPGDNQPPVANFTFAPESPKIGEVITFQAEGSSDPDGRVVAYDWDFNNDGVFDAQGHTVTRTFNTGGSQIVTLRVLDNKGAADFKTTVVVVQFVAPVPDFTYTPAKPVVGGVVRFDGSASKDPDGQIVFYEWDFDGDGKTDATGLTVNRVFRTGGTIPVTLTATDNESNRGTVTKSVYVEIPGVQTPRAAFTYAPAEPRVGTEIQFTDQSQPGDTPIKQWLWDFGDGVTSTERNPKHKYVAVGQYTVALKVTDEGGLTAEATQVLTVGPGIPPTVTGITVTPPTPDQGTEVTFIANTTSPGGDPATSWEWDFGDGSATQTTTTGTAKYTYAKSGVFTVRARARNAEGGWSAWKTLNLYVRPKGGALIGTKLLDNPAPTQARIDIYLPAGATNVKIQIFDMLGRPVVERTVAGTSVTWDLKDAAGRRVADGLYVYLITATVAGKTERSEVGKILVLR